MTRLARKLGGHHRRDGIGRATAEVFARAGIATDVDAEGLARLKRDLEAKGAPGAKRLLVMLSNRRRRAANDRGVN